MQVIRDNNITICTALYHSSGFFIIMSPAEGLHFSVLVHMVSFVCFQLYDSYCLHSTLIFSKLVMHINL